MSMPVDSGRRHALLALLAGWSGGSGAQQPGPIAYLTPGLDLPFWRTLSLGVKTIAEAQGLRFTALDSRNDDQRQLANAKEVLARGAAGLVISPTSSRSAVDVLDQCEAARVPAVVADIGTAGGSYLSYVKSDNYFGAFGVGQAVATAMKERGWTGGDYAMCTIALDRKNGQDRTNGFRDAMKEAGFGKEVAIHQMRSYTIEETEGFVRDLLNRFPKLRGLFVEVDKPTLGALQAIKAMRRSQELVVGSFDGIPEFVPLLRSRALVAVGMQQPFLMGTQAAEALLKGRGGQTPPKQILVPVLIATGQNVDEWLPVARRTVFGNEPLPD
ncbi:MAG: ribose ABC transporter substrate-binding protein [Burkholderiales bacterium]|uniref:substrate-binding domain-containing protein n=2 Tax=Pseudomonadota TaxID=1224 RepID=UPI000FB9BD51|nr:MAG: ribose ABC transporter substrate-binding protein [Burkholderiales bacterium]